MKTNDPHRAIFVKNTPPRVRIMRLNRTNLELEIMRAQDRCDYVTLDILEPALKALEARLDAAERAI